MYARFGQELYTQETLTAATVLADACDAEELLGMRAVIGRIATALPQGTPATRQRIAVKLLQRIAAGAPDCRYNEGLSANETHSGEPELKNQERLHAGVFTFARLLAHLPDTQARRELVFYSAACADALIGAIAREILYPYFIEERIPPPYEEDEFLIANAGLLLAPEPILTTGVVSDFARRAWGFDSERTVALALRILRQAGILLSAPLLGERGRVAAYTLAPHGLSLPTLLWGLHQEYGQAGVAPAWDQVGRARIAQLFVVPPSVVTSRLWEAERAGLVGCWSAVGTRRVALKVRESDAIARLLLSGPYAK